MIPFNPPPEPLLFDEKVRQPGKAWLAKNPYQKKELLIIGRLSKVI